MDQFKLTQFNSRQITRRQIKRFDTRTNDTFLGRMPEKSLSLISPDRGQNETPFGFSFYPDSKPNDLNTLSKETKDLEYSPIANKMSNDTSRTNQATTEGGNSRTD